MAKIFSLLMICLLPYTLVAANFHALLIRDTQPGHWGQDIQKQDIKRITENLGEISRDCGVNLHVTTITSKKLSTKFVWEWLGSCEFADDDCVVIYFTGRGFCPNKKKSEWPAIYFERKKERMELSQIEEAIDHLKPRLAIILYDASNADLNNKNQKVEAKGFARLIDLRKLQASETPNFKDLFLHTRGKVIVAAARPGDLTYFAKEGNLFTRFFLDSVRYVSTQPDPSWEKVMDNFKGRYILEGMAPLYRLSVSPS